MVPHVLLEAVRDVTLPGKKLSGTAPGHQQSTVVGMEANSDSHFYVDDLANHHYEDRYRCRPRLYYDIDPVDAVRGNESSGEMTPFDNPLSCLGEPAAPSRGREMTSYVRDVWRTDDDTLLAMLADSYGLADIKSHASPRPSLPWKPSPTPL